MVEQSARTAKVVVEVRIDGARVGKLSPKMSGDLLPAVQHLAGQERATVARALVKGNRIKAEVTLYALRAHELPHSWLGPAAPAPVIAAAAVAAPVIAAAAVAAPVIAAVAAPHRPVPPPPTGVRFAVPPGWPQPPDGWTPPPGWTPDPSWPPAPEGWQWWELVWE
ncbi:hypothetical protein ACIA5D_08955 [Actinoplanes sp. NPDC051513]|uniref:hypothetical protein n=1 Tax=Actinoplanes sp. NPDC051513 TaxID=3363908 RepID=UPI00378FF20F